ncbi:Major facilitator superfamily multidrug-resistance DHA1 sub-family [Mycena indigotica]|uniref:Major facilitator superfamily multidrug-resistance DHA1 sub-family n=1 Tax=Mycena indigotica TaxID=2126181 RepID=A0A8H6WBP5_9AGAR|nr:Major facilitator superfamily multidrug-resistance DHA1 sub-family [Mycena indigotica]KAF7312032.1 Major facilitator superfamily multidrug-resistance DHA1 sub-family [Mycena indigotica]
MSVTDVRTPTERTTLLSHPVNQRTPLQHAQLAIVMLVQICEPLTSQSIYPYINQLISELDITGGDEKKVGYYAGMEALFFLAEAIATLHWSRASDAVGRKPILLIGLFGSAISMLMFGLSRTFLTLVISRSLCGLLNANVSVMKSTLGDLTDRTNRADAFVFLPIVWATGASLGPLIGGSLARPHDRFPQSTFFSTHFWLRFPYFLPCLVVSGCVIVAWSVVLAFLKETAPRKRQVPTSKHPTNSRPEDRYGGNTSIPMRQLMTFPVVVSISNYVVLALLNIIIVALIPLFLAMPITIGGLGLDPPKIGWILCIYGFITGLFNLFFFARLVRWIGEKRMFVWGLSTTLLIFPLFPLMNALARERGELWWGVYALITCLLFLGSIMDVSFGAIFMFVTASAPASSRGAVNGLSQTSVSLARSIGPILGTSLFSVSVQKNLLGGYFVYVALFSLSCIAVCLADRLPDDVWNDIE